VDDQPIFIAGKIKDHAVVGDEINCRSELSLHIRWAAPGCLLCRGKPQANRLFGLRMTLPKLLQSSTGDHLHSGQSTMSPKRLQGSDGSPKC
jgi:hypothetical protein